MNKVRLVMAVFRACGCSETQIQGLGLEYVLVDPWVPDSQLLLLGIVVWGLSLEIAGLPRASRKYLSSDP